MMRIPLSPSTRLKILSCISWFANAAIITERNDLYNGVGCYTPPQYTFVGTPSRPGIDSCWIPYGTYTDGVGGTEYTRVTSNLMGVVASALGGACERGGSGDYGITALRPLTVPQDYVDGNDYFSSATNTSLRLSDQINLGMLYIVGDPHGMMFFRESSDSIEPYLARTDTIYYQGDYPVNGGRAGEFGSRVLEQLVEARDPPISTSWTSRIPYDAADADEWVKVCPTFAACSNDLHFYTATNTFVWRNLPYLSDFGKDVDDAFDDLFYALTNRHLNVTMEDVLSYDTGWKTNDYTHWRNGTTRLDWKRLGIICQLERQMEIRYDVGYSDLLPFRKYHTENSIMYDTYVTLDLPSPDIAHTTNFPWRSISPSWTKYDENYSMATNDVGWTYPTCRIPATSASGGVTFFGEGLTKNITLDSNDAVDMLSTFVQAAALTNGEHDIVIYGNWTPQSSELWYHGWRAEDWAWVTHPSNTVTTLVDGKTTSVTGPDPIASRYWYYSEGQYQSPDFMDWELRLSVRDFIFHQGDDNWQGTYLYCYLPQDIDTTNGTYTTPSVVFTAIGEDDDFTNWTWQTTGILGTNCVKTITGDYVQWQWTSDESERIFSTITFYRDWWDCYTQNQPGGLEAFEQWGTNAYPRVISSPAISVTWQTNSYRQGEVVWTNETPDVLDYRLPIVFDATNATVRAMLGVQKLADGAWTCSGNEDAQRIVDRFGTSWNRMHSERRLSVEGLLYDCGPAAHDYATDLTPSTSGYPSFVWDAIKYHSGAGRLFRMQPDMPVEATSKAMADSTRLDIIRSLDNACKDQCVEMGGANPRDLANFGKVTANDVASIKNALLNTDIVAHYGFGTPTNDFVLAGHISDSEVVSCAAGYDTPGSLPVVVGYCGWTLTSTNVSASTATKDVRADGHQRGIVRSLWKFKNLRDPTL